TAAEHGVLDPFNPAENIRAGVKYLKQLLVSYEGRVELALAAYNAGPGAGKKYGGKVPPYRETQNYVARIQNTGPGTSAPPPKQVYRTVEIVDGREVVRYSGKPRAGSERLESAERREPSSLPPLPSPFSLLAEVLALVSLFNPAEPSPLALVGRGRRRRERPRQPRQPPHFDLLLGRPGSPIFVELARLGLRDVPIGKPAHHDDLLPAHPPADHDLIPGPDLAVRLGGLAVHVDPAGFTGFLGLRARAEEARDIQPDVEPQGLHAIIGGLRSVPRCYRAEHSERGPGLSG